MTIIQKLTELFPAVPVPIDPTGKGASVADSDYGYAHDVFSGKKWTEIKYSDLQKYKIGNPLSAFILLSEDAFRYYLPAAINHCLAHMSFSDIDFNDYDTLLFQLMRKIPSDPDKFFDARYAPLSLDQKNAVAQALQILGEFYRPIAIGTDYDKAMANYWAQYLPEAQ